MGRRLPVALFDKDRYFFGDSNLYFIADLEPAKDSERRICTCKPRYLCLINASSWTDDMPADGELTPEVKELSSLPMRRSRLGGGGYVVWGRNSH